MEPNSSLGGGAGLCSRSQRDGRAGTSPYLPCIFGVSLSVLVTCGNVLVITSVVYFRQLHTPTNYLVLSLATADLLVGVLVLPLSTVLSVAPCSHLGPALCRVRGTLDLILCGTSILNLCFISADRYYAVCRPLAYRTGMTPRAAGVMIAVNWCVPALLTSVTASRGDQSPPGFRCSVFNVTRPVVTAVTVTAFIPAVAIFSIYMKILTVALRQARSVHNPAVSRSEGKATRTLAIVVGMYLTCWTPYFLSIALYPATEGRVPRSLLEAFKWLGWSNSMFNPFVYGFFYRWFRCAFKMIVCGKIFRGDFTHSKLS